MQYILIFFDSCILLTLYGSCVTDVVEVTYDACCFWILATKRVVLVYGMLLGGSRHLFLIYRLCSSRSDFSQDRSNILGGIAGVFDKGISVKTAGISLPVWTRFNCPILRYTSTFNNRFL